MELEKLTENVYLCEAVELAIVHPIDTPQWIVIDKGVNDTFSKIVFGPSNFEQCRVFVESVFLGETSV